MTGRPGPARLARRFRIHAGPACCCDGDLCEGETVACEACEREVGTCTAVADRWCDDCAAVRAEVCS